MCQVPSSSNIKFLPVAHFEPTCFTEPDVNTRHMMSLSISFHRFWRYHTKGGEIITLVHVQTCSTSCQMTSSRLMSSGVTFGCVTSRRTTVLQHVEVTKLNWLKLKLSPRRRKGNLHQWCGGMWGVRFLFETSFRMLVQTSTRGWACTTNPTWRGRELNQLLLTCAPHQCFPQRSFTQFVLLLSAFHDPNMLFQHVCVWKRTFSALHILQHGTFCGPLVLTPQSPLGAWHTFVQFTFVPVFWPKDD